MRSYYFIRHGSPHIESSEFNVAGFEKAMLGLMDPPLSVKGRQEALALAEPVRRLGVERLISSTLLRASETASLIAQDTGIPFEHQYDDLKEFAPGAHAPGESRILDFLASPVWPQLAREWFMPKLYRFLVIYYLAQWRIGKTTGGDSLAQMREKVYRILSVLDSMPETKIAAVCHGYWIFFLKYVIAGARKRDLLRYSWVHTCSVTRVDVLGERCYRVGFYARNMTANDSYF